MSHADSRVRGVDRLSTRSRGSVHIKLEFIRFNVQFNLPTTPGVIPGDVNNDGVLNVADVTDLENYLEGLTGGPAGDADVNNDMVIDGSDSLYLTNYLVGNGPTPP